VLHAWTVDFPREEMDVDQERRTGLPVASRRRVGRRRHRRGRREDGFQADNGAQTNPTFGQPILRSDPRLLRFGMTVAF
jgi:hypothetical protein